jgi:hypothetical protein
VLPLKLGYMVMERVTKAEGGRVYGQTVVVRAKIKLGAGSGGLKRQVRSMQGRWAASVKTSEGAKVVAE